jgi:hypothetical protein
VAIDVRPFPNCCTMAVLTGFGGSAHGGAHSREREHTQEELVGFINTACTEQRDLGMAILTATTSDDQTLAVAALREAGFAHSRWAEKINHRDTRVRVWYKRLNTEGLP